MPPQFQGAVFLASPVPVVNNFFQLFRPVRSGGAAAVAETGICQKQPSPSTEKFQNFKFAQELVVISEFILTFPGPPRPAQTARLGPTGPGAVSGPAKGTAWAARDPARIRAAGRGPGKITRRPGFLPDRGGGVWPGPGVRRDNCRRREGEGQRPPAGPPPDEARRSLAAPAFPGRGGDQPSMVIFLAASAVSLGRVMVSTPLSKRALASASLTLPGRGMTRENEPYERSMRW